MVEFKCQSCGKFIPVENGITTIDGYWVCDEGNCRALDEENDAIKR